MKSPNFFSAVQAVLFSAFVAGWGFPSLTWAAPGDLDSTFGLGGVVTSPARAMDSVNDALVQSDGMTVVAGIDVGGIKLVRYTASGALDSGFGSAGVVSTPTGGGAYVDYAVALDRQTDGKLVVAASVRSWPTGNSLGLWLVRYTSAGALDSSFGTGGIAVDSSSSKPRAVKVQADGKILIAGDTLLRFNANGTKDSAFGSAGAVASVVPGFNPGETYQVSFYDVIEQSDGKLVAAGWDRYNGVVLRFLANGTLDTSFGTAGVASLPGAGFRSVALQADGKILAGGGSSVLRLQANGSVDTAFGSGGVVTTLLSPEESRLDLLAVQGDGKIIAAGKAWLPITPGHYGTRFALVRYTDAGVLDSDFGSAGIVTTLLDEERSEAMAVGVDGDGKIILAGDCVEWTADDAGVWNHIAVARYMGGDLPPAPELVIESQTTVAADGGTFASVAPAAVSDGYVGGLAMIRDVDRRAHAAIYGGEEGSVLIQAGDEDPTEEGAEFSKLDNAVFGAGGLAFSGTVDPGSGQKLVKGLWAQFPGADSADQLSAVAKAGSPAPGVPGASIASFTTFALPQDWPGVIFTGKLKRGAGIDATNDQALWRREAGSEGELLLRNGSARQLKDGSSRGVRKFQVLIPVTHASDQRRGFARDGSIAVAVTYAEGGGGVLRIAADGQADAPVEDTSAVFGLAAKITKFGSPATASGGRYAVRVELDRAPGEAILASLDGGAPKVIAIGGETVRSRSALRQKKLGDPLFSESGVIGWTATLSGPGVTTANNQALFFHQDGATALVVRTGQRIPQVNGAAVFARFQAVAITDTVPARTLFTATLGGAQVKAAESGSLWSFSPRSGLNLLLRGGQKIETPNGVQRVRAFSALNALPANPGQGRSTDESGFATARATLDGAQHGVLRVVLP